MDMTCPWVTLDADLQPWLGIVVIILGVLGAAANVILMTSLVFGDLATSVPHVNLLSLVSLAVAGLGRAVLAGFPFSAPGLLTGGWIFGPNCCQLFAALGQFFSTTYILTLAVLAYERFQDAETCRAKGQGIPVKKTYSRPQLITLFCWIVSIFWATIPLLQFGSYTCDITHTSCDLDWRLSSVSQATYVISYAILGILAPLVATMLWLSQAMIIGLQSRKNDPWDPDYVQAQQTKFILVIAAASLLAMLPKTIFSLWTALGYPQDLHIQVQLQPILVATVTITGEELQDVEFSSAPVQFSPTTPSPIIDAPALLARDPAAVERSNLVNISKLVVKELIETSLKHGRMLDSDHMPLQHFFIVLEHVLRHGLKPKKKIDIDIFQYRTHMGRARAWLRLALMQKKLADYVKELIDHREDMLSDYYEPEALMMSEEAIVIMGLLVGLNFLRLLRRATVTNLQAKVEALTTTNALMKEDIAISHANMHSLQEENAALKRELQQDTVSERMDEGVGEVSPKSDSQRAFEELKAQLENERRIRLEAQKELDLQLSLKAEMEVAMKLLEKDIHEKQDTIVSLRRQLDDIKYINLEMYRKLEECEQELTQKGEMVNRLQAKTSQIGQILTNLERYNLQSNHKDPPKLSTQAQAKLKQIPPYKPKPNQTSPTLQQQQSSPLTEKPKDDGNIKYDSNECDNSIKHKTELISKLESKTEAMAETIQKLEEKCNEVEGERKVVEETTRHLSFQVAAQVETSSGLEGDLKLEREWRRSLEDSVMRDRDRLADTQAELAQLKLVARELESAKEEVFRLKERCREQDLTLEELGCQLSGSKLQVVDLQEELASKETKSDAQWASDKTVTHCRCCSKEFNLTRRKHHCRYCGEIFCNSCSDNTMALPSSAKPVRVCDACHITLVAKYSGCRTRTYCTNMSTKYSVYVTRSDIPQEAIDILKQECHVEQWNQPSQVPPDELLKGVVGKDALFCLLTDKINEELIQKAGPKLKVVGTMSVGYDHVDVGLLRTKEIKLGYTPNILTDAVAELTMGLVLATTVVDQDALLDALRSVVLPHIGSATTATRVSMAVMTAHNILAGLKGEPMPAQVC
ncbi:hypothetical protein B566_EDAN016024 [Ephemera danica]|nr:hypothetical protein B566_EDAN016024 [Ephemera danica]